MILSKVMIAAVLFDCSILERLGTAFPKLF